MRQNGLRASSFVAVADVDPRIADQLLDLLAFAHVAAYAEPVPGHVGVYRDHHVPTRPIDRLWVDREATGPAREVLDRSLAHLHAELETAIAEGVLAVGGTSSGTERRSQVTGGQDDGTVGTGQVSNGQGIDEQGVDGPVGNGGPVPDGGTEDGPVPEGPVTREPGLGVDGAGTPATDPAGGPVQAADQPTAPAPGLSTSEVPTSDVPTSDVPSSGIPTSAIPTSAIEPHEPTQDGGPAPGGPDLDQATVDARWREIVAGWDGPAADGDSPVQDPPTARRGSTPAGRPSPLASGTSWPGTASPAPRSGDRRRTDQGPVDPTRRRENRVEGRPVDLPGPRDHALSPDDEHFSPPAPTVHPPLEKTTRLGWAGLVVGLVVLVVVVAVGSELLPGWVPLVGVALLVGGFAALVSRLHRSPTDEDDHDPGDGAVV